MTADDCDGDDCQECRRVFLASLHVVSWIDEDGNAESVIVPLRKVIEQGSLTSVYTRDSSGAAVIIPTARLLPIVRADLIDPDDDDEDDDDGDDGPDPDDDPTGPTPLAKVLELPVPDDIAALDGSVTYLPERAA